MNFLKVELSLDTKTDVVAAGTTLEGVLHMETGKTVQTDRLALSFRGEEYAKVYHRVGQRVRTYIEKEPLVELSLPAAENVNHTIRVHGGKLPADHYRVPFSIKIPSSLPSSCEFGDILDSAKIEYTITASLEGSGFVEDHSARQVICVQALPKPIRTIPYHVPPQCEVILGGPLFLRGLVATGAQADDTLLIPGQQMNLDIAVVNDSLASVHKIIAQLWERAEWTVQEHTRHKAEAILEKEWDAPEHLRKKDQNPFSTNPFKSPDFDPKEYFSKVQEQLDQDDENLLSLKLPPLPETANNSYSGKYLKVTHELKVTLHTHALNSDPEFCIPIRVARGLSS